jgi:hypothetical protein
VDVNQKITPASYWNITVSFQFRANLLM